MMDSRTPKLTPLEAFKLEDDRVEFIRQAAKLEWWTILFMITVVVFMYLTAGQSESMKTALLEDVLSLIPPAAFLIGSRMAAREPDHWFPYGYRRATLVAYLAASVALMGLGLFAFYESSSSLISGSRPTLGLVSVFGYEIWEGWLMLMAILYSAVPPVFLGRKKEALAKKLEDPTLSADAATNRADWLTGLAAALGVLGIGVGWWWADATMALMISIDIVRDGTVYLRNAVGAIMDKAPSQMGEEHLPHPIIEDIRKYVSQDLGLEIVEFRLRSIGLFFTGYLSVDRVDSIEEEELADMIEDKFHLIHDLNVAYR